jgi:hypothetical protein
MAMTYEDNLASQLSRAKQNDRDSQSDSSPIEPGGNFRRIKAMAKNLSVENLKNKAKEKVDEHIKKGMNEFFDYLLSAVPGYTLIAILKNYYSKKREESSNAKKWIKIFIALYSNISYILIVLAVLGIIALVFDFATKNWWDKIGAIYNLGWGAIQMIIDLFLNLIKGS